MTHKAVGSSRTRDQVKNDRKTKKDNRAAKVVNAKAKLEANKAIAKADPHKAKGLKTMTHEEKIKKKAKVEFSAGASRRLNDMGLHGKNRKAAKKFQKKMMMNEMKKKGATKGIVVYVLRNSSTLLPLVHASPFAVLPFTQAGPSRRKRTISRHSSMTPEANTSKVPGSTRQARPGKARSINITFTPTTMRESHPFGRMLWMHQIIGR